MASLRSITAPTMAGMRSASAFASSSRVGLDFVLPSAAVRTFSSSAAHPAKKAGPMTRWEPLDKKPFWGTGGVDRAPTHTLTITSTRNNTLLTFSDRVGPLFPTVTGGSDRTFKKAQRSSYEAAHQAALKMFGRIGEFAREVGSGAGTSAANSAPALGRRERVLIRVAYRGIFGQGREAVHSALSGPEGADIRPLITRVEDRTPIKIGGTRARKARRL